MQFFQTICTYIYIYIRCIYKSFLRRTTKLCELQRICYGHEKGFVRSNSIEYSIGMSRSKVLRKINSSLTEIARKCQLENEWMMIEDAIEASCVEKKINVKIHKNFIPAYRLSLIQIYGYKQLLAELTIFSSIAYDSANDIHVQQLKELWNNLMDKPLTKMVTKEWGDIGFQGDDPSTDFRGMGMLGLENLHYFSSEYRDSAKHILQHSLHPVHGYPFACAGINITHLAYNLFSKGHLKSHFYNSHFRLFSINDFNKVYCYLFVTFDKFWLNSRPQSVMEFNHIRDKFEEFLIEKLSDDTTILKWDPQIETL